MKNDEPKKTVKLADVVDLPKIKKAVKSTSAKASADTKVASEKKE